MIQTSGTDVYFVPIIKWEMNDGKRGGGELFVETLAGSGIARSNQQFGQLLQPGVVADDKQRGISLVTLTN